MSLDFVLGPQVIAGSLSSFALGINTIQFVSYLSSFPTDSFKLKGLICFLYFICLLGSIFASINSYLPTVTYFGDSTGLTNSNFAFALQPGLSGIISFTVQIYYARRVYGMSAGLGGEKNKILPFIIGFLAFISTLFSFASTILIFDWIQYSRFNQFTYGVVVWLGGGALVDTLITISIFFMLRGSKKRTTFLDTTTLLDKIIRQSIANGAFSAAMALGNLIVFLALPKTQYHMIFIAVLPKIYLGSVLASLNSRKTLRRRIQPNNEFSAPAFAYVSNIGVRIEKQTVVDERRPGSIINLPRSKKKVIEVELPNTFETCLISKTSSLSSK